MATRKQKAPTKAEMAAEIHRLTKLVEALRGDARAGIDEIKAGVIHNTEILDEATRGGAMFGALAHNIVAGLPMQEFAIKATIGFIYAFTLMTTANWAVGTIALLAVPGWISFVLSLLVVMSFLYVTVTTVGPVSRFVFNTGSKVSTFMRRELLAAREWVENTAHELRTEHAQREAARSTVQ